MNYTLKQTSVFTERQGVAVDLFVIHETAGRFPGDLNWLVAGGNKSNPVSSTWYIAPDGELFLLDQHVRATAHAGESSWEGESSQVLGGWGTMNLRSEGVEVSGLNNGTPFKAAQISTLQQLVQWRTVAAGINPSRVVRHSDIAPGRKTDPAGLNWESFIGQLWPEHYTVRAAPRCSYDQFLELLQRYDSPAVPEAVSIWEAFRAMGVDPAGAIAIFEHESSCGTRGRATQTLNWGNLRTGMGRQKSTVGGFAVYGGPHPWLDSASDFAVRLLQVYGQRWGLTTYDRIIPTYAPRRDNNKPTVYIRAIRERIHGFRPSAVLVELGAAEGSILCSAELQQFYDEHGGLLTFGYPLRDAYIAPDVDTESCIWLPCENGTLKVKPSLPEPWRIRLAALDEAIDHR